MSRRALELAAFAALAVFAAGHWVRLVSPAPFVRALACVGIALALALALVALARLVPRSRRLAWTLGAGACLAALLAGLLAIGLPARLLAPAGWEELSANLETGLGGIETTELPYDGEEGWLRLTLLAGLPLMLTAAAGLAFWPAPRLGGPLRFAGLAALLFLYGTAAALDSPGAELAWGVVLLALVAVWLWAPGLVGRGARLGPALAALLAAALLAVPAAAGFGAGRPWWDYERWNWFGVRLGVEFDWDHTYGPSDWPREGTTLFEAGSDEPHYWKASVLDRFDGYRWTRAALGDARAATELLGEQTDPGFTSVVDHPGWVEQARFEVRNLRSGLVIGFGIPQVVSGLAGAESARDGTTFRGGAPLHEGDSYTISAYAPQPRAEQMRGAPQRYRRTLRPFTAIALPGSDQPAAMIPLRGSPASPALRAEGAALLAALRDSRYARTVRLARRLTAGAPTIYDAVTAVERHLERSYDYTQTVPEHDYPLPAFLFADRAGYCQQFSGAMALMLRISGIPSRVVSGFAPGAYEAGEDAYVVRDYDAHSWVEVYFTGIGWVPFDPTPAAAPASQATGFGGAVRGPALATEIRGGPEGRAQAIEAAVGGGNPGQDAASEPTSIGALAAAFALAVVATGAVGALLARRRRRRLLDGSARQAQLREFLDALRALGWSLTPGTTLLAIERRFAAAGRPQVERYAARLRRSRFGRPGTAPPGPAERRALRSALVAGRGPLVRARALLLVPPGGPAGR